MDPPSVERPQDREADELSDRRDRDELRDRYYGLLQELRVLLPGVQILVAFLFTIPFAARFDDLDELGRDVYGVALVCGILAVLAFTTPTVLHRIGPREARSQRLVWAVRCTRLGLLLLAVTLLAALAVVTRYVFGPPFALVATLGVAVALGVLWVVLPRSLAEAAPNRGDGPT